MTQNRTLPFVVDSCIIHWRRTLCILAVSLTLPALYYAILPLPNVSFTSIIEIGQLKENVTIDDQSNVISKIKYIYIPDALRHQNSRLAIRIEKVLGSLTMIRIRADSSPKTADIASTIATQISDRLLSEHKVTIERFQIPLAKALVAKQREIEVIRKHAQSKNQISYSEFSQQEQNVSNLEADVAEIQRQLAQLRETRYVSAQKKIQLNVLQEYLKRFVFFLSLGVLFALFSAALPRFDANPVA